MENQPELLPVTTHELASIMPDIVERYMTIRAFAQSVLQPGIDYAKIPGTGDKNTLLLPGAQKLRDFFNLTVQFHLEERIRHLQKTNRKRNKDDIMGCLLKVI